MPFDTEKFIEEVESRPILWNNNVPEFENKSLKDRAWKELCDIFVPNYPAMDSAAKNREVVGLQRRWKSLRDSFNREIRATRRGSMVFDPGRSPCLYYNQLSFLRPILEAKMRDSPGCPYLEPQQEPSRPEQEVPVHENPCKRIRIESVVREVVQDQVNSTDPQNNTPQPQRIPEEWQMDGHFFKAMLPHLNRVPKKRKLALQMAILELIKKYRKKRKISPPIVSEAGGSSRTTPAVLNGAPGASNHVQDQHREDEDGMGDEEDSTSDTSPGLSTGYTDESVEAEED